VFSASFDISGEETRASGIAFSEDGTRLFITGSNGADVNQYSLDVPFDISNAATVTFDGAFSFPTAGNQSSPSDVSFSNDGLTLFVTGLTGDEINQYSLTTPFDVSDDSTITFAGVVSTTGQTAPEGITFNDDGTRLFVVGTGGDDIDEYTLDSGTAFDVSGGITNVGTVSITTESQLPHALEFSPDGSQLYVVDDTGDEINVYDLSSAFDTSTISFVGSLSIGTQDSAPTGLAFSADGGRLFVVGDNGNTVDQYDISSFQSDTDGDGIIDQLDLDSDNDGISDLAEASADASTLDADNNGILDGTTDIDSDGLVDVVDSDTANQEALSTITDTDSDSDGIANRLDLDSDNDLIADAIEGQATAGFVVNAIGDADSDGILDVYDGTSAVGSDGSTLASFSNPVDTDSDGIADFIDTDSDNDTFTDRSESGLLSNFTGVDSDSDGIDDGLAVSYTDADGAVDGPDDGGVDGDGIGDFEDIDDDNDGITDADEGADPSVLVPIDPTLFNEVLDANGNIDDFTGSIFGTLPDGTGFDLTNLEQ